MSERIIAAAARIDGATYSMLPPARHGEVLRLLHTIFGDDYIGREEQGFVTDRNRFVDRAEARKIATAARQLNQRPHSGSDDLFSEDLW